VTERTATPVRKDHWCAISKDLELDIAAANKQGGWPTRSYRTLVDEHSCCGTQDISLVGGAVVKEFCLCHVRNHLMLGSVDLHELAGTATALKQGIDYVSYIYITCHVGRAGGV
jgi:hypothetical protein